MQKTTRQPAPVPAAPRPLTPEELKQVSGGSDGYPTMGAKGLGDGYPSV